MIWMSTRWNLVNLAFAGLLATYPLLRIVH